MRFQNEHFRSVLVQFFSFVFSYGCWAITWLPCTALIHTKHAHWPHCSYARFSMVAHECTDFCHSTPCLMVKKYADFARNFTELWFSSHKYMKTKHFGTRNNAKHLEKKRREKLGKKSTWFEFKIELTMNTFLLMPVKVNVILEFCRHRIT